MVMGISTIQRDQNDNVCIVRIITSDSLAAVAVAGYVTAQTANITVANSGAFTWQPQDTVLINCSDGSGFFDISPTFSSFIVQGIPGNGTVTSITAGAGLSGGTITTSGTIALSPIANLNFLANKSGGTLAPVATALATILQTANNLSELTATASTARANLGLGSLSLQSASAVAITGGSGVFSTLTAGYIYVTVPLSISLTATQSNVLFVTTVSGVDIAGDIGLAAVTNGFNFAIKNVSAGNVTFTPLAGEFIDGAASLTIPTQGGVIISKTATQWSTIAKNSATSSGITNSGLDASGEILVSTSTTAAASYPNFKFNHNTNTLAVGSVSTSVGNSYNMLYGFNNTTDVGTLFGFAFGNTCGAMGEYSLAFGNTEGALGNYSLAFGSFGSVKGNYGLAFGNLAVVDTGANFAMAFGNTVTALNPGSHVYADSTGTNTSDTASNQFVMNFNGGYKFYGSTNNATLGVEFDNAQNFITHKGTADQSYSYQVPTTGFFITIPNGVKTLTLAPSGTLATGTIQLPSAPIKGQEIRVHTTQTITALSVIGNAGQGVNMPPTTLAAGQGFELLYDLATTTWNPLYQSSAAGGSGTVTSITAGTGLSGGTITTSGTISLTAPVTLALGGTNNISLTASNGGIAYSDATKLNVLAGTATANQMLMSGASSAPTWSTAVYPNTAGTSGNVITSDGTNFISSPPVAVGGLTAINYLLMGG